MQSKENLEHNSPTFTNGSCESLTNMNNCSLLTLTSEILAEICENLSPKDLYTLTIVCKKLRHFLWATSGFTQQIWRKSRISIYSQDSISPPKGICEQQYIWLKELGNSCHVCRVQLDQSERHLVWEFKRLCCKPCLLEKTTSFEDLLQKNIPKDVLDCLPNIDIDDIKKSMDFSAIFVVTLPGSRGSNPHYWTSDVHEAYREYNALNDNEREEWVEKKGAEVEEFNRAINEMEDKRRNDLITSLVSDSNDSDALRLCRNLWELNRLLTSQIEHLMSRC
ncbi:16249_t:CDS:2 [Dentiscutata erythropus]|uniref:16249_t:CDS:1 n=1 Tax=Dentiscutata erythropus TaxID=1348616 RepID=A0A9N9A5X7_9GLOM|nr:16249_t:CDS:2 [Dentiscutata erythropus]